MLGAVVFGHEQMQAAIKAINELVAKAGKPAWDWKAPAVEDGLVAAVARACRSELGKAYSIIEKQARHTRVGEIKKSGRRSARRRRDAQVRRRARCPTSSARSNTTSCVAASSRASRASTAATCTPCARSRVETGVLPRTHGSALFTRGETQALVTTTLGTGRDAQIIDALAGERKEPFMLHYNFPPFSVGETGMMGSPKRREIGHGNLARRGVHAVMPDMTTFPYIIRVVSEILESNGSSSMASVCGTSLALMDAGVPFKAPVAGIAMGLVLEGGKFQVLTDILGDEDHLGDMDFKVAGTRRRRHRAADGHQDRRHHQGNHAGRARFGAQGAAAHPRRDGQGDRRRARPQMSEWAPTIITMKIDPEKIREVIGKGGAVIRAHHRRDGHHDRHRERRHGQDRVGQRRRGPRSAASHRADHVGSRSRLGSTKARSSA